MADLQEDARAELASQYDCPKCRSGGELSAAPNDDMPNAGEYDFLCTCGRLYNLTDVQ
jgi:hypothetical protein